jgi:hypothetical protein
MNYPIGRFVPSLLVSVLCSACTLHSTVTEWNGRSGPNGRPVFLKSSTNIGLNIGILVPILGNTTLLEMIDETTAEIAEEQGDRVRVIESSAENYWYGFPPLTWVLTPVVTVVTVEYEPDAAALENARQQREQDDSQ